MVDAVIFDLDGLLLESEQVWNAAKERLTNERGGRWRDEARGEMLGMSSPEWSRYMREELSVPMAPEEISAEVVRLMREEYRRELPVLPGAADAVARLAARWPLGLASSSNRELIDMVLERARWADLFAATVSSEEVARGKPAPDVYLEAARLLGAPPERCVAVEDSSAGIRSADAAGLAVVAVPNRDYRPEDEVLAEARVVIGSLRDLDPGTVEKAGDRRTNE